MGSSRSLCRLPRNVCAWCAHVWGDQSLVPYPACSVNLSRCTSSFMSLRSCCLPGVGGGGFGVLEKGGLQARLGLQEDGYLSQPQCPSAACELGGGIPCLHFYFSRIGSRSLHISLPEERESHLLMKPRTFFLS